MVMGSGALLCQTEGREPQMNADERRLNEITEKIIGCAYDFANGLGSGFLRQTHHTKSLINLRSSAFISGSIFSRGGAAWEWAAVRCFAKQKEGNRR